MVSEAKSIKVSGTSYFDAIQNTVTKGKIIYNGHENSTEAQFKYNY
jgi:hypothetical protein